LAIEKSEKRETVFQDEFREDLAYWIKTGRETAIKILDMAEEILRTPLHGTGKPEPLRYLGTDVWSRRITLEHRIVYVVSEKRIDFVQCRYHY